ncbi:SIMPL domain-containing protein [Hymenobacter cheonanensis]|uniref:SIMPL domain-containing protein n=1 Tax=Hymenobacter sp. CA2-7 TaxID=3063993 RepID=UPI002712430B|nr:SIMPL domain-containing protein [Hymenobacter sp. CA2-7]MDO7885384.1 SIMPL domain-containing protein [Hymenobacter sp. CA2-7]
MQFFRVGAPLASRWLGMLALVGITQLAQAQVAGNQVTGRAGRYQEGRTNAAIVPDKLFLTDSTFLLGANVMQHVKADSYVAVFGLRQEASSIAATEKRLAARVQHFTHRLSQLGVASKDVYTDIIAQERIKDVRVTRNPVTVYGKPAGFTGEEYLRGFESTRNVIVSFRHIAVLDDMLVAAAADSIFDLVKVDYIVNDPEAVYTNLFKSAAEVINRKKANYLLLTGAQLRPAAQPYLEQFSTFVPAEQYQSYEAAVTAPYYSRDSENDRYKGLPALTTRYYSPPSSDSFDRVINPVVVEPVVTFTLAVQVKYTLQKPARRP